MKTPALTATASPPQFGLSPVQTGMSRMPSTWRLIDTLTNPGGPLTVSSVDETACVEGLKG